MDHLQGSSLWAENRKKVCMRSMSRPSTTLLPVPANADTCMRGLSLFKMARISSAWSPSNDKALCPIINRRSFSVSGSAGSAICFHTLLFLGSCAADGLGDANRRKPQKSLKKSPGASGPGAQARKKHININFFVRLVPVFTGLVPGTNWDKSGENQGQTQEFSLFYTVEARFHRVLSLGQTRFVPGTNPGTKGGTENLWLPRPESLEKVSKKSFRDPFSEGNFGHPGHINPGTGF